MNQIATAAAALLAKNVAGAKFASFTYTAKGSGEVAKTVVILGASTSTLYAKDLKKLARMRSLLVALKAKPLTLEAVDAIIASRKTSLEKGIGQREDYTNRDTYTFIGETGLKVHNETGEVYVSGLAHAKTVLVAGAPKKPVNSRPLTIVKNKVEYTLPSSRFRTYALGSLSRVAANGEVLEIG